MIIIQLEYFNSTGWKKTTILFFETVYVTTFPMKMYQFNFELKFWQNIKSQTKIDNF